MAGTTGRQAFRLDVNYEIMVRFNDGERDMKLLLVDISESGCRLRAGVKIPPQTKIAFNWIGPSREPIHVYGRVVAAKMFDPKTAEYGVQFGMPVAERDRLAAELAEIQRRKAYKPTDPGAAPPPDEDALGGRAKRTAYRAPVTFPVSVRAPNKDGVMTTLRADANDLSVGGLMLCLPQELPEETEVELSFTLPLALVDLGGEEKEVSEMTPFGERKVKKLVPVRPFDPIKTKGKIVKKVGMGRTGGINFGCGFIDLAAFTGEEIARFVHAYQLTQLRKAAATQA